MQKTYWWRIGLLVVSLIVLLIAYIEPCNYKLTRCLWGNSILITRTFFHIFLAILASSLFTFFISDKTFFKWLRFAVAWFALDAIFVTMAPVYTGGWINFDPTKELVSIWMGSLFVIISLIMFVWGWIRKVK